MPFSLYRKGRKGDDATPPEFFICTPCTSGKPCANYVMSMVDSCVWMGENNVKFDYWLHTEDCHVDDARNFLVKMFMDSGAPYMIFIDDDVGWDTEALAKLLCYQDADIVGGAYPLRQSEEDYPVRIRKPSEMPTMQARGDGLLEVEGVPTGFMRISRKVVEAISEKRKHLWFRPKESKTSEHHEKLQIIFERMMVDGHRWSGDLNFCREARMLGFKVWVDPEINFSHMGMKRWEGHLGNYLRRINGVLDSRLDMAIEKLITGDDSLENFAQIFKWYNQPFAMGPMGMKAVYDACLNAKGPILEVGSGLTSVIAGLACRRTGNVVHSLEHDLEWFRITRNYLQAWKVRETRLYYAPLAEYPEHIMPNGKPLMWYGDNVLNDIPTEFDVAIIDGPPRRFGREGVYLLALDRIKNAKWVVDDCDDPKQFELVNKYAEGRDVKLCGSGKAGMRHHALVT